MAGSRDGTSGGCFSGIFRRMFCIGDLPGHPSEELSDSRTKESVHSDQKILIDSNKMQSSGTNPGIVARLMGLESFPDFNLTPKGRTFGSFLRSRSVNFIDYLPQFDLSNSDAQHRRVRTSVSFRELPPFDEDQKHDFFVICLKKDEEEEHSFEFITKSETNRREMKQKKVEKGSVRSHEIKREKLSVKKPCKRVEEGKRVDPQNAAKVKCNISAGMTEGSRERRVNVKGKREMKAMENKKACVESNLRKKTSKQKKFRVNRVQPECRAENLSPISLLHLEDSFPLVHGVCRSEISGKDVRRRSRKSFDPSNSNEALKSVQCQVDYPGKSREFGEFCSKLVEEICRLTAEDVKSSEYSTNFKGEDFEEICKNLEQQVFDLLLNQTVEELVVLHLMKNLL